MSEQNIPLPPQVEAAMPPVPTEKDFIKDRLVRRAGAVAMTALALMPFLGTYREFSAEKSQTSAPTAQELENIGATHTSQEISHEVDARVDFDSILLPRLTIGEKSVDEHTLKLKIDEKWAEWFSADQDAGKVINAKDPRTAMDFIASSIGDISKFEESIWSILRGHKDLFEGSPTDITSVEITGHASAEDEAIDDGLQQPSEINQELADTRAKTVGPEFIKKLKKMGIDSEKVSYGEPVEDSLTNNEVDLVHSLVEQFGYSDAVSMVRAYNQAERGDGEPVPDAIKTALNKMLGDERYVEVVVRYKTTDGRELSITLPWFLIPLAALPTPRLPDVPSPVPVPTGGEGGPDPTPMPPRRPRPVVPPVPLPKSRTDRRQERLFSHNGVGHGTSRPTRRIQPQPHNYIERKGLPNGRRGRKSNHMARHGR